MAIQFAKPTSVGAQPRAPRDSDSSPAKMAAYAGIAMALIIAGTVFAGKTIAFASIPCFIVGVILLSLNRPIAAIAFYFTYDALEGMFKYLSGFSQAVYIIKPGLAVIMLGAWWFSRAIAGKKIRKPPFASLLGFWMAWGCVEIFFPTGAGVFGSSVTFLTWYLLPVAFYFYTYDTVKKYSNAYSIVTVLMSVSTIISVFALVQYGMGHTWTVAHLPGYENITQHNWWTTSSSGHVIGTSWSPASTTSYSGIASIWSNMGVVLALGLLLTPIKGTSRSLWLSACLLLNIMALLASGGRTFVIVFPLEAMLLFAIGLRLQANPLHTIGLALVFVVIIVGGYAAAQGLSGGLAAGRYAATASNPFAKFQSDRGGNFLALLEFIPDYPLGIGYQRGTDQGDSTQPLIEANRESEFNAISADMGVPGLILVITVTCAMLWKGWRCCTNVQTPAFAMMGLTIFVLLLGNMISFFVGPTLQGADYLWVLFAVLFALPPLEKTAADATRTGHYA